MTTWILILTIWGTTSQSGRAIATAEFNTKETCMTAAQMWLDQSPKSRGNDVSALCAPTSKVKP